MNFYDVHVHVHAAHACDFPLSYRHPPTPFEVVLNNSFVTLDYILSPPPPT